MKWNPVYRRELTVGSRSIRMTVILLVFNGILAAVALFNLFSVVEQVKVTAEIQYSRFLELYIFVSLIEFVMLMFIMPALTASSISGERERQTLELMLTTTMEPRSMVLGRLWSSLTVMLVLAISALPIQSLVFVYGGITIGDMALLFVCHGVVAVFTGGIGMFCSAAIRRSTIATASTYVFLVLLVAGTFVINVFAYRMALNSASTMEMLASPMNPAARQPGCGAFLYLLLLNPALTFYALINGQAGTGGIHATFEQWFGAIPNNIITQHWVIVSLALQLLVAVILITLSVYMITPRRKRRMRAERSSARKREHLHLKTAEG